MIRSRLFGAASLALLIAACSGQQTGYDSTTGAAPGELPPAAETTPATSPDAAATPPVDSTASTEATESTDTATMGDATDIPVTDPDEPVQSLPPNPARNPDPMAEEPPQDRQDSTSPPPPVQ